MKTLIAALTLGTLAAPALVQSAIAQPIDSARGQAIQECMVLQKRYSHDTYSLTGGVQHHYRACMANHGQPE
jgi:hypothetical protein